MLGWLVAIALLVVLVVVLRRPAKVVVVEKIVEPRKPVLSADAVPRFRVLRFKNDKLVESLAQGEGAHCRSVYESIEPVEPGEEIRFYRGDVSCSAKRK